MTSQYFDAQPDVASDPKKVAVTIAGSDYIFTTDRGVFSYEKIDKATRILLDVFSDKFYGVEPAVIADVGCGYGTIMCAVAKRFENAQIIGIEPNERAAELARGNYSSNLRDNRAKVISPAKIPDDLRADLIISNPPIRVGKEALYEILEEWVSRLNPEGQMWLVIAKNLGADSASVFLENECAMNVHRVASKKGFRVLRCVKKKS